MIVYDKLWITMAKKKISQYDLVNEYGISKGLLDRLRNNRNVTANSLNMLCTILNCPLDEIAEYIPDKK